MSDAMNQASQVAVRDHWNTLSGSRGVYTKEAADAFVDAVLEDPTVLSARAWSSDPLPAVGGSKRFISYRIVRPAACEPHFGRVYDRELSSEESARIVRLFGSCDGALIDGLARAVCHRSHFRGPDGACLDPDAAAHEVARVARTIVGHITDREAVAQAYGAVAARGPWKDAERFARRLFGLQ